MVTPNIVQISTEQALPIRLAVLRRGTPSQDPNYSGDHLNGTVHFGAELDDELVATSTWIANSWPLDTTAPATQLRGMAVLDRVQKKGIGNLLLDAGVDMARRRSDTYVWARSRSTALEFYQKYGFTVVGEEYLDESSGLPHFSVVIKLRT